MAANFAKLPGLLRKQYADGSVWAVPQSDLTGNFRDNRAQPCCRWDDEASGTLH